jgi:squalene-associated FAD-dependent desaturase
MTGAQPRVVVVGGGLAGLSAAIGCLDGGARVTLLEARPRLGGATWSFERRGLEFDNGQHVHLRCCTEYRSFLERLGTAELAPLQGSLALPVLRAAADAEHQPPRIGWIRRSHLSLPAPLHLAGSLLAYCHLSVAERLRLFPPALKLRRADLADRSLDDESFGAFLARHGQSPEAIEALWDLIALPTTNLRSGEVSLLLAAKVFQTGLLTRADAADIGWSQVPLARLHVDPAAALIERLGGEIRTRARVTGFETAEKPARVASVRLEDGGKLEADAVVLAVPHDAAAALLPAGAHHDPASLRALGTSPIVNVHMVFDRRVTAFPVAAGLGSLVQFVFDRTRAAGVPAGSPNQVLAVSVSGADAEIGERPEKLIEAAITGLRRLFPSARGAEVLDAVVTREHDATFRGVPGTRALRFGPRTGLENLHVAGAWTDTGWPATMEGAVRSGRAAASSALSCVGRVSDETRRRDPAEREEVVV